MRLKAPGVELGRAAGWVQYRAAVWYCRCAGFVVVPLLAGILTGAINAEFREKDPPRKMPGGLSILLAWPRPGFPNAALLLVVVVSSARLLPKQKCYKLYLAILGACSVLLLYGPLIEDMAIRWARRTRQTQPRRDLVLTWSEFASRHGCEIEKEPAIRRSLAPYKEQCSGRITSRRIRAAVERDRGVGISITNSAQTAWVDGAVRKSDVAVFGNAEAQGIQLRLWHSLLGDLRALADMVQLPSVDFAVHLKDGFSSGIPPDCVPIFVQEKTRNSSGGVLAPPRSSTGMFDPQGRGGYLYDMTAKQATRLNAVPFRQKRDRAVFKGTPTGEGCCTRENWRSMQRTKIVELSLKRPDLLDAHFTGNIQADPAAWEEMVRHGLTGPYADMDADAAAFKLVVVPDGNSVPDRLLRLLARCGKRTLEQLKEP